MVSLGFLDSVPLWILFLVTIAIAAGSLAAGHRLGQHRRTLKDPENVDPVGAMVGATLGLLGFILAFTFGMAATRFDQRREIVMDEANAIGTVYLRAEMLNEPHNSAARKLLREYVDARLEASSGYQNLPRAMVKSTDLQNRLWAHAVQVAKENPDSMVMEMFVTSLNDVIDIHSKRVMVGLRSRIPGSIWLALFIVAVFGMALLGYYEGLLSNRRSPGILALVITFSTVLLLIADLDRAHEGWLRVSQESMIDLKKSFETPGTAK